MRKKTPLLDVDFYKTEEFQQLQQDWYGKLKQDGFEDIEKEVKGERVLRQRASYAFHHTAGKDPELLRAYYALLSEHLAGEPWANDIDRIILTRLAEGATISAISKTLKELGQPLWHRQSIRFRIRKYEHNLGIRHWTEHQLNPPWRTGKKKQPIQ